MGKRTREQERQKQQLRRSRERSQRRTLKNITIDDEDTLRKALEDEGIHVSLSLEYAVIEKLRRICVEHKRGQASKAWEAVAHLPVANRNTSKARVVRRAPQRQEAEGAL
jgi:hypothetical protein